QGRGRALLERPVLGLFRRSLRRGIHDHRDGHAERPDQDLRQPERIARQPRRYLGFLGARSSERGAAQAQGGGETRQTDLREKVAVDKEYGYLLAVSAGEVRVPG